MYYLTCGVLLFLFIFSLMFLLKLAAPLSLAFLFFFVVLLSTFGSYLFYSDYFPYMLYLIYIGGLLVLMVYMVIISTNYQLSWLTHSKLTFLPILMIFLTTVLYYKNCFLVFSIKSILSTSSLEISSGALIALVLLLLYVFMYICENVRLGGRALNIGIGHY